MVGQKTLKLAKIFTLEKFRLYGNYYIPINVWANQYNYSLMASLYLYGDLLDCIVGLNLMIKTFL